MELETFVVISTRVKGNKKKLLEFLDKKYTFDTVCIGSKKETLRFLLGANLVDTYLFIDGR